MTAIIESLSENGKEFISSLLGATVNGNCYHFALAMHRALGWSLIGLIDEGEIIHAGVKSPEGKIWDGRGEVSEDEFSQEFVRPPFVIRGITERDLLRTGIIKEHLVEIISKRAQLIWPNLPWKKETIQGKVYRFTQELAELSQKYGLWIAGNTPASLPIIFEGFGDEDGYRIIPTDDGSGFIVSRILN